MFRPIVREQKDLMDYNLGYPQFWLGDIRSHDVFTPCEHKDLMDYNFGYSPVLAEEYCIWSSEYLMDYNKQET